MPFKDEHFGSKLKAIEQAVGFRFPARHFSNTCLAKLLRVDAPTMSNKKSGGRYVTEKDCSELTRHFDLERYGCDSTLFTVDLATFEEAMREVGRKAQRDAKPNKAREDLLQLAGGEAGGRLRIELAANWARGGGIGFEPRSRAMPAFMIGDRVRVRVPVSKDGYMILLNDDWKQVTCLMPSHYAPRLAVKAGDVVMPTSVEFPHFPVGDPTGHYRLYALWFAQSPSLAMLENGFEDASPRAVDPTEFTELVEHAKLASTQPNAVMVACGDYEVK